MKWIILLYIILNPLFFWVDCDQRNVQQLFYQLSSILVFCAGFYFPQKSLKFDKLNASIATFVIAYILAWLLNMNGWFVAQNVIFGFLVYITIIKVFNKEDIEFVFKGLGYLTAFCVIVLAFQMLGWDFRGTVIIRGLPLTAQESIFFQRSAMGMFFGHSLIALLLFSPISLLLLLPIKASLSTGAFLGVFSGIFFFYWFRKRLFFWIILGCLILSSFFIIRNKSLMNEAKQGFQIRLPLWSIVIQDIVRNPIGHGLDSFANPKDNYYRYYNYFKKGFYASLRLVKKDKILIGKEQFDQYYLEQAATNGGQVEFIDHPHNEYISLAYEIGLQGLIILGFIYYFIWDRFKKSKRNALTCVCTGVLICMAMESLLQFPFHLARVGYLLPIILGFFYISSED